MEEDLEYLQYPKFEDINWVYASDWYDYYLAGVCESNGKRYYAMACDQNDGVPPLKWYRRYLLYDLTEEIWKQEDDRNNLFCAKVGTHWMTSRNGCGIMKPQESWKEYYDKYPSAFESIDFKSCPIVGYFED